jgi:intein/homing endonuclease
MKYYAGIFDGEGNVGIVKSHSKDPNRHYYYTLRAAVTNKSKVLLRRLREEFRGGIYPKGKNSDVFRWDTWSNDALSFLETVYPYLLIKSNAVWIAICFQRYIQIQGRRGGEGRGFLPYELEVRESAYQVMRKINKRSKSNCPAGQK